MKKLMIALRIADAGNILSALVSYPEVVLEEGSKKERVVLTLGFLNS